MTSFLHRVYLTPLLLFVVTGLSPSLPAEETSPLRESGEVVGSIGQDKIYRNQLDSTGNSPIVEELHQLFLVPTLEKYYEMHKKSLAPTEEEVQSGVKFLLKFLAENKEEGKHPKLKSLFILRNRINQLKKDFQKKDLLAKEKEELEKKKKKLAKRYAEAILVFTRYKIAQSKLHHHFYVEYGTGWILTQNGDEEAFDGAYRWIADRERRGVFKIEDEELN